MKGKITMKKILKVLIPIILIGIILLFYISFTINNNKEQLKELINTITKKYKTEEKIIDLNRYGEYTILTTKNQIIIINKEYKEIKKEELSKLKKMPSNYKIIYKENKIMYETTKLKNNKLKYQYYDAITGQKISSIIMELK